MGLSALLAGALALGQPAEAVVEPEAPTASEASEAAAAPDAAPDPAEAEAELSPYQRMERAAAEVTDVPSAGTPEYIRSLAASDRNHERYFARAGATRADYESEWEGCRQIALRLAESRSSGSWALAGGVHGGLLGGVIAGAIDHSVSLRRARRDLRRECLIARGWRMIEPGEEGRRRIGRMRRADRDAYFDRMLGSEATEEGARVTDLANLEPTSLYFAAELPDGTKLAEAEPPLDPEAAERQRLAVEESCRQEAIARASGNRNQQAYLTRRCIARASP